MTLEFRSIEGEAPSDGLFHFVTLAFPGELSIPLTTDLHVLRLDPASGALLEETESETEEIRP